MVSINTAFAGLVFVLLFSGQTLDRDALPAKGETAMDITVSSTAFKEGEVIPQKYTCDGENVSPPLEWSGIPKGDKKPRTYCGRPGRATRDMGALGALQYSFQREWAFGKHPAALDTEEWISARHKRFPGTRL